MRTQKEALIDRVLLLYTISKVNEHGCMEGPFKLMKVPFRAQRAMNEDRKKGFSYTFFRWRYGPMSTEIYDDRDVLVRAGYVSQIGKNGKITLTEDGAKLLRSLQELFDLNSEIIKNIEDESKKCAKLDFGRLKALVYDIRVRYADKTISVRDVPAGMQVLGKISTAEAKVNFELDDDWIDSLHGIFDRTPEDRRKFVVIEKAS